MDDASIKSMVFGVLIVAVYGIHQVTVGGDGIVVAGVMTALGAAGGFAIGRGSDRR